MELHFLPDILFLLIAAAARWLFVKWSPIAEEHAEVIEAVKPIAEATPALLEALDIELMDSLRADSLRTVALAAAMDLFEDGTLGRDSFDVVYEEALELFDLKVLSNRMRS